jgi:hypothetical protein
MDFLTPKKENIPLLDEQQSTEKGPYTMELVKLIALHMFPAATRKFKTRTAQSL